MAANTPQQTILIADDTADNISLLGKILSHKYKVKVATNGKKTIQLAKSVPQPDLILLDILMPGLDGYETCARLKADSHTQNIPVIFITALSDFESEERGLELGAVDYITKPFNPALVQSRVHNHLSLKLYQNELEKQVVFRTKELALTREVTIAAMGTLAEYRDPETGGHIQRTQNYVKLLAQALCDHPRFKNYLNAETIELLYQSAPLHDIGKVGIRDTILLKPGKLSQEEFDEMKHHALIGRDAILKSSARLGDNSFLRIASELAASHHEKWDGSGYPFGLKGDDIPMSGRLMALADVYDALISKRVYKPPFPHKEAVKNILEGKGSHFDPDMVDAFSRLEDEIRIVALQYADFDEEKALLSAQ